MAATPWELVEARLDAALDLPVAERATYLAQLRGEDPVLADEVSALLASCEEADDFLENPAYVEAEGLAQEAVADLSRRDVLAPGARVGTYRVEHEIGRGGMGMVYLASRDDGQYTKQAALKVVKRGMDTAEIVERFRFERQVLARLEHPNIARLIDGGVTDDGRPYFVLEYVDGIPIDQFCADNHLDLDARVRLFQTVCAAVDYAHRNLVVHRDLKPTNVLVTADGTIKLLDFGIAKVLDQDAEAHSPVTRSESRRLTPEYAAPEQIRGTATTTATDVYALGIMLYELLTGRRPYGFETRSLRDIERTISEVIPHRPSTVVLQKDTTPQATTASAASPEVLRRKLAGDLDAVTLKALKKEPNRRYATAGELLEDLKRYESGYPVTARDDTARYRAYKLLQRYRGLATVTALAFVFLLTGIIASTLLAREASREAARARRTLNYVDRIFERVNPEEMEEGLMIPVGEMVRAGMEEINGLEGAPLDRATIMVQVARVSFTLGATDYFDVADSLYHSAATLRREALGADHPDLAEALHGRGEVLMAKYQPREAIPAFEEAYRIRRVAFGLADPRTLASLNGVAEAWMFVADYARADSLYRLAVNTWERSERQHRERAVSYSGLSWARGVLGRTDASLLSRQALTLIEADPGSKKHERADAAYVHGQRLQSEGAYAEAETFFRQALQMKEEVYGADHFEVAEARSGLAELLRQKGALGDALEQFTRADSIYASVLAADSSAQQSSTATWRMYAQWGIGKVLLDDGRPAEARAYLEQAVYLPAPSRRQGLSYANLLMWYGRALLETGAFVAAEEVLLDGYTMLNASQALKTAVGRRYVDEHLAAFAALYTKWEQPMKARQADQALAEWRAAGLFPTHFLRSDTSGQLQE